MIDKPLILVVDDEPQIHRFLRHSLVAAGFDIVLADNGARAMHIITTQHPALMVLDLGLPDRDGKSIIGELRQTSDMPIIVLSARDGEAEKIAALDLGANDYVAKPFGIGELLARIRACLRVRKAERQDSDRIDIGTLTIDVPAHRVVIGEEVIKLTPKEFDLLLLLAQHPGRVMTHRQILSKVWGPAHVDDTPYLRVFIGQLRHKIEANPTEPRLILTEPGVGYRMCEKD